MNIIVSSGVGSGLTELSAFDSALNSAGVANYNLLCLSSVIPPKSSIIISEGPISNLPGSWGDKLYVVMADMRVSTPGEEAWAGIGWVQEQEFGKGLFVEHHGSSENETKEKITDSLNTLMRTRNIDFGKINMQVSGMICKVNPVCALVVAVYQVSSWDNKTYRIEGAEL